MAEMSQEVTTSSSQAKNSTDSRPIYEVGFHLVPDIDEAKVTSTVEQFHSELAKGDAEIIAEGAPRKIALAYTVERATTGKREKYNEAYFGFIKFAIDREHIPALETLLRTSKEVLRHLLVETVREELVAIPRRTVFASDRLEGETLKKPTSAPEKKADVSEEDLDKSIEALVA